MNEPVPLAQLINNFGLPSGVQGDTEKYKGNFVQPDRWYVTRYPWSCPSAGQASKELRATTGLHLVLWPNGLADRVVGHDGFFVSPSSSQAAEWLKDEAVVTGPIVKMKVDVCKQTAEVVALCTPKHISQLRSMLKSGDKPLVVTQSEHTSLKASVLNGCYGEVGVELHESLAVIALSTLRFEPRMLDFDLLGKITHPGYASQLLAEVRERSDELLYSKFEKEYLKNADAVVWQRLLDVFPGNPPTCSVTVHPKSFSGVNLADWVSMSYICSFSTTATFNTLNQAWSKQDKAKKYFTGRSEGHRQVRGSSAGGVGSSSRGRKG